MSAKREISLYDNLETKVLRAGLEAIDILGGSTNLSLRSLARAVGCSHVNLYNYFSDVADLRWRLYCEALTDFRDFCFSDMEKSPGERMLAFARAAFTYAAGREGRYRLLWLDDLGGPPPAFALETISRISGEYARISAVEFSPGADAVERGDIYFSWILGQLSSLVSGRVLGTKESARERVLAQAMTLLRALGGPKGDEGVPVRGA